MSVLNISKAEIDFHIIVSYNNFHLLGFGLQFWQALVRAKIILSFKKKKRKNNFWFGFERFWRFEM